MRFEVLTAVMILMVLWLVTQCGLLGGYQRFEEHTASVFTVTTQNTDIDSCALLFKDVKLGLSPRCKNVDRGCLSTGECSSGRRLVPHGVTTEQTNMDIITALRT
jgi:hypothetical protein